MAGGAAHVGSYSPITGFVFIFNLIVGAGALTIPRAFAQVGLLYGALTLSVLALSSYVTATFMVEAIAGVNAIKKRTPRELEAPAKRREKDADALDEQDERDERDETPTTEFMPLMVPGKVLAQDPPDSDHDKLVKKLRGQGADLASDFDLSRKMELAQMAHLLYNRQGIIAFYTCVVIYLYGDLAIYAVAVPKSMREIVCPRPTANATVWECGDGFNSSSLYRFFVVVFGLVLGPFAFGNVQKTQTLQFITTVIRHASFGLMILLAAIGIIRGQGRSIEEVISYERPANIATMFGVCIYSFMCHHSIPGLVAPITDKTQVGKVIFFAFVAVLSVYLVLCSTATFRFHPDEIDDVYTLNFKKYPIRVVAYFLSLFPVCTLSANFPVITITLRENLRTLAHNLSATPEHEHEHAAAHDDATGLRGFFTRNSYALVALVPPLIVAFFTEDVSMLVGYTGAYAGLGIQWVVPATLVFCLRRRLEKDHATAKPAQSQIANPFASPFASDGWLYLTFALSLVAVVLITVIHAA